MKSKFFPKQLLCLMVIAILVIACTSDESSGDSNLQNANELRMSSEIDNMESVLEGVIINAYENQENNESRMAGASISSERQMDCATVTVVMDVNYREITVDFGSDGCVINGHFLQGQVIITYTRDPGAQEVLINYELVDFYCNLRQLVGTKTILKELSNDNGNPQFTHTLDLTIIWPNGAQASRDGVRVTEWVEGLGTAALTDNVFEVTGYWNATFVNGNSHNYEVVTPLRWEVPCTHFVSGTIQADWTNFSGVLDYGNGTCDNEAIFTSESGQVFTIILDF